MSENLGVDATPPSRRTLVKGAAWAVPAVVVAAAAPAMAASPCLTAFLSAASCKQPGTGQNNFGYRLQVCFNSTCSAAVTVELIDVRAKTGNSVVLDLSDAAPITIPAGGENCSGFVVYCSNSSASNLILRFSLPDGSIQTVELDSPPRECGFDLGC